MKLPYLARLFSSTNRINCTLFSTCIILCDITVKSNPIQTASRLEMSLDFIDCGPRYRFLSCSSPSQYLRARALGKILIKHRRVINKYAMRMHAGRRSSVFPSPRKKAGKRLYERQLIDERISTSRKIHAQSPKIA